MNRRLPPLGCLKAFEAGGRILKLSKAAEELNVTPSAVSHMIRRLEDDLGVRLFRRVGRQVELTDAGAKFLPSVRTAFEYLQNGVNELHRDLTGGTLTICARPYFAMKWLAPRIGKLWPLLPDVEIRLRSTNATADFVGEDADVDIDLCAGDVGPEFEMQFIIPGTLAPICSPALCSGDALLENPEDLVNHTLLRDTRNDFWPNWLEGVGLADLSPARNIFSNNSEVRVQAALDGQGVDLGCLPLIHEELASGKLITPFDHVTECYSYYLIRPNRERVPKKVLIFSKWIADEARTYIRNMEKLKRLIPLPPVNLHMVVGIGREKSSSLYSNDVSRHAAQDQTRLDPQHLAGPEEAG